MPVTASPRLGITRWSAETDPFTRTQLDGDHALLDELVAIDVEAATLAGLGAPGIVGRYGWVTGTSKLYRDDGVGWQLINPDAPGVTFGVVGEIAASNFGDAAAAGATGHVADAAHRHPREANPVPAHVGAVDPHADRNYAAAQDAAHVAAADPHAQYALDTDLAAAQVNSAPRYTRSFLLMGA